MENLVLLWEYCGQWSGREYCGGAKGATVVTVMVLWLSCDHSGGTVVIVVPLTTVALKSYSGRTVVALRRVTGSASSTSAPDRGPRVRALRCDVVALW